MKRFIFFILIASAIVFGIVYSFDYFSRDDGVKSPEQALLFGDNSLEKAVSEKQLPVNLPPPLQAPSGSGRSIVPAVTQDIIE